MIEDEELEEEQDEPEIDLTALLNNVQDAIPVIHFGAWGHLRRTPEVEVEPGKALGNTMEWCPACGGPITECTVHDEEELEILRLHEAGVHDQCMPEGCEEASDAEEKFRGF